MTVRNRQHLFLKLSRLLFVTMFMVCVVSNVSAQDATPTPTIDATPQAPERVDIIPAARDDQIERRLQDILIATSWFADPQVRVQDGVVFLTGETQSEEFKTWASELANSTQDVVAVVNQITVLEPSLFDFTSLTDGLLDQWRAIIRSLPLLVFSLIVMFFAWILARMIGNTTRGYLELRGINILLRNVISRLMSFVVFLLGLYVIFQVAGWTNIAFTILGGTGLIGLILGIAFRDITENFLASIFLSIQNPFNVGDLVEINDVTGFVQRMTTRTTILMTLAGNHVQIPNATVYKSIIHNFTSNPNRQIDFSIGIGYDDSISLAQETIRHVLEEHPAVLNDPEHLVLVTSLGSSTVNLQIYFWLDGTEHSWVKVKSSVIRLVKLAIQDAGISMPDDQRELIFPQGIAVELVSERDDDKPNPPPKPAKYAQPEDASVSTQAEGDLKSEANDINEQASLSRTPETGENLLKPAEDDSQNQ